MRFLYISLLAGSTLCASDNASEQECMLALNLAICKAQLEIFILQEEIADEQLELTMLEFKKGLYKNLPDSIAPQPPEPNTK